MIKRDDYLNFLIQLKDKKIIKVITGIRRCGKSTLFDLYKDYLITNGVDKNQIISLNFEDPKNSIYNNWRDLYDVIEQKLQQDKINYIFLDEIQVIDQFEKIVDGLFIKNNVDLYITGSNSYMLSGELATYLTGRYMQIHMLPLSFKEYFEYKNDNNELKIYQEYIENGGFPYLVNLHNDKNLIRNYLDGIYNTVLMKDVISRNNTLNSNNRKNSVNTIENYLSNLVDSYIIYKVDRYDIKGKEYLKTLSKYYVCDLGLRNYLLGEVRDLGSILENIIFLELKRLGFNIYTGKIDDKEIDFIIKDHEGIRYIQVSLSVRDENTLKRELEPLECIKDNYPKYIITLDYDTNNYNGIKQISAIDFLLGRVKL